MINNYRRMLVRAAILGSILLLMAPRAGSQTSQTGLLFDDVYLGHLAGNTGHPERPERLTAIRGGLEKAGLMTTLYRITPRRVTDTELELVHKPSYVALVRRELSNLQGVRELSTGDTLVSPASLQAAEFAAGGVLNAVDAVMTGKVKNAFAAVRPPGHHATPDRGMGFCIFNNVAIAARYLQKKHGIGRVLIVDWDYHHGNGTQDIFYNDGSVFYFSTHHYGAYPGTGASAETGAGPGAGKILNVPMRPGDGDAEFLQVYETKLVPAARQFKPDFILVSAGFDSMQHDLLGQFNITPQGYAAMTRVVMKLADEFSRGRLVSVLEGGYRLDGLAESVAAHVKTLQGGASVPAADSQAGTWIMDVGKSQFAAGKAPKRQVTTIEAVTGGVKNVTDILESDGKSIHYEFTAIYDSKDYPVKGDPVRDSVSIRKVDDYTFEVTNKKAGKVVNTVRAAYARDGKTRTMTTTGVNSQGEKTTTTTFWNRQ
jgi:acetoin utilization deacetylase AcuC-like enzyme